MINHKVGTASPKKKERYDIRIKITLRSTKSRVLLSISLTLKKDQQKKKLFEKLIRAFSQKILLL